MRLLISLLLAVFLSAPAWAGANIVQKGSGATVWEDDAGTQSPAGDSGLMVDLPAVSTASTTYVISHKKGTLVKAYAIVHGIANAGTSTLDFHIATLTTGHTFVPVTGTVTGASATNRLSMVATATGTLSSVVFADVGTTNQVDAGDVIAIHTDGASTGHEVDNATIVLIIE